MYTVPAKVSVQAKTIITAFEKGQLNSLNVGDSDEVDHPKPLHPELSHEELAEPGTAKKLLLAFELKRQESQNNSLNNVKSPTSGGKLAVDRFSTFGDKASVVKVEKQTNGVVNGNAESSSSTVTVTVVKTETSINRSALTSESEVQVEKKVVEISKEVNGNEKSLKIESATVSASKPNTAAASTHEENVHQKIEKEIEQKVEEKVEARVNHAVQEKVEDKIETRVEDKVKEKIETNTDRKVEGSIEVSKDSSSKDVEIKLEVVTEVKKEKPVAKTVDEKREEKIEKAVEERIEQKKVEKAEDKVEQKIQEAVSEKVEQEIKESVKEKAVEKAKDNAEQSVKKDQNAAAAISVTVSKTSEEVTVTKSAEVTRSADVARSADVTKSVEVTRSAEGTRSGDVTRSAEVTVTADVKQTTLSQKTAFIVSAVRPDGGIDSTLRYATMKTLEDQGYRVLYTDAHNVSRDKHGAPDYESERRKLMEATFVIFHFRPILNSPPAALKTWFEGTLIHGNGNFIDKGLIKGKKSVLLITTEAEKVSDDRVLSLPFLSSIQDDILRAISLNVLTPHIIFGIGQKLDEMEQKSHVDAWAKKLASLVL